jgi:hypothetical protein
MSRTLLALVDLLSIQAHEARRKVVYEWSGTIARDLRNLRAEIDALRAEAGLSPSPIEPAYPEEENETT